MQYLWKDPFCPFWPSMQMACKRWHRSNLRLFCILNALNCQIYSLLYRCANSFKITPRPTVPFIIDIGNRIVLHPIEIEFSPENFFYNSSLLSPICCSIWGLYCNICHVNLFQQTGKFLYFPFLQEGASTESSQFFQGCCCCCYCCCCCFVQGCCYCCCRHLCCSVPGRPFVSPAREQTSGFLQEKFLCLE